MYKTLISKYISVYLVLSAILFAMIFINYENNDNIIRIEINDVIIFFISSLAILGLIFYLLLKQKITNKALIKTNEDLDRKIELEIKRNRRRDVSLLKQSKMSSITEMLNHIAHQWRQPLNVITTSSSGLIIHKQMDSLDDKTFDMLTKAIEEQASYLSNTIENFRYFLEEHEDNRKKINLQLKIEEALNIVKESFEYENIKLVKNYDEKELFVTVSVGDFIQVLLNILNNAKDALIKNCEKGNRELTISLMKRKDKAMICVEDNAGGVPNDIAHKIFDPYFTTKHEAIGTGISLYLCYEIITQQEKGKLYFKNKEKGAKFYIEVPLTL